MSIHESDLKSRLTRFLVRKRTPRHLEGNDAALADEIAALVAVLTRNAPRGAEALADWWSYFEPALSEACGMNYPTEREIREAAKLAAKSAPQQSMLGQTLDMRDIAITARRMQRGEPVGEGCLWGIAAVEMIAEGLIDREVMERYRRGAFLNRCERQSDGTLDRTKALAWEAERKAAHEAAKAVWRDRDDRQPRDASIPTKTHIPQDFAA